MIKINLNNTKKQFDFSNIGGFDFTKIKIKALAVVIVLIYLPDFFLLPVWEEQLQNLNQALTSKQIQLNTLKTKASKTQEFEKQITELKAQEENLGKKLIAVKQAISEKKNPSSLLLYIAKNIPPELWIEELSIENDVMLIKGEALDYTSIGKFVTSLRSSVFIKDANIIGTSSNVKEGEKRRIESFQVKFIIARFDQ
ncbi:MAG: PilN domain-containing protein [Bacteriovoracaceae bacterium]